MKIRNIDIWPPVALAPMVGLSHSGLRSLVQAIGGVGLLFTEMLAAKRLPNDNPDCSPLLRRTDMERPLVYQLVSGDLEHIGPAIEKLHRLDADGVDLNLGCPAPIQKRQGAGSALALNHPQLSKILKEIRNKTELPLSVKIRLGTRIDDNSLADTCRFYEDQGVDLITVHGRLIGEKFCRKPRWDAIAAAKRAVSVPVFANGGIFSVSDAKRCLEMSGADGLMIGRGAVEQPWLCGEISHHLYNIPENLGDVNKRDVYIEYIRLLETRFPVEKRLGRLKQFTRYYSRTFTFGHHLASTIQSSESMTEASERAEQFFLSTTQMEITHCMRSEHV
ncbi:tRNA-dihydrouridine synthase [Desulforhopalus sp. IMCC35007]|uniref:tRNA dihydrouridine synthase n=1 Tax=Desulforhopalus sp. IMCC35007 TaxID=2569543 RepID=UPI0010ADAEAC|nr:tRNA-dihydrouridine synthase family protein [Desulforhopalus sp. IMCC35007]TKB10368.1 tRNA-dihydrouridine synthase family protein [Desulforhopalus sp. IMCC35007]